jgi:hypothetical protein
MLEDVPTPVQDVFARWRTAGSRPQQGMTWPRDRWITYLPQHADALRALPELLDRDRVRRACSDPALDAARAEDAFLAVMAWGYGGVGYGPYRTHKILTATPDAGQRLSWAARRLRVNGALAAYEALARADDCALVGLGPSFGTKFLYYCQPRPAAMTALILDSFVADWLRRNTELKLDSVSWSVATYRRYLDAMHAWAASLGCDPDELECAIFETAVLAEQRASQWAGRTADEERRAH